MQTNTAYYTSPIGVLEIRSSGDFICSVLFTDNEQQQHSEIPAVIQQCINELDEYFKGERIEFTVPFYQEGTGFQKEIWNALLNISCGKTASYLDIAKKINNEKSIRAVGNANSKNKISIIVPCHRVIGKSGNMVGYAGGIWRKQWLLEHEAKRSRLLLF